MSLCSQLTLKLYLLCVAVGGVLGVGLFAAAAGISNQASSAAAAVAAAVVVVVVVVVVPTAAAAGVKPGFPRIALVWQIYMCMYRYSWLVYL